MRDELNEALKQLDRVSMVYARGTDVREHVDLARSQVMSALLCVLKSEADDLREHLAETERGDLLAVQRLMDEHNPPR